MLAATLAAMPFFEKVGLGHYHEAFFVKIIVFSFSEEWFFRH
jgi:hypothetical protein